MKYIKKFESKNEPSVGDYVVINFIFENPVWSEYINNSIGKIVHVGEKTEHDDKTIPGIHAKYFVSDEIYNIIIHKKLIKKDKNGNKYIIMKFDPESIIHFSKDKDVLIPAQKSKNYNL